MAVKRIKTERASNQSARKRAPKPTDEVKHYEIHRLLEYPNVRNIGSTAKVEYLGEFAPGANIEDEIEQRYGEGWYRVSERLLSGKLGHSWVVRGRDAIEELDTNDGEDFQPIQRERIVVDRRPLDASTVRDVAMIAAQAVADKVANPQPVPAQSNGFDDWLKTIERVEAFKAKIVGNSPAAPQAAPAPVAVEKPLEDRLLETVIVKALEKGDDSTLDKVLDVLRPTKEPSLLERLGEFVSPMLPAVAEIAKNLILSRQQQPMPTSTSESTAANPNSTTAQGESIPSRLAPQMPVDPAQRAWQRVFQRMVEDCLDGASVFASVSAIEDLETRFPQFGPMIDGLVNSQPQEILSLASIQTGVDFSQAPHAIGWLMQLQKELASGDNQEQSNGQVAEIETHSQAISEQA